MAMSKSVWGIDIGQCALKALKLREVDGQLQVEAFDVIEHPKILSEPDVDKAQAIRDALSQFLSRNSVVGDSIAISVPGQSSFTRFVKMPPVEPKKIPSIVVLEAQQQIPFPIDEVIWRWQPFHDPDSPDIEVGIFAMKRQDVGQMLGHLTEAGMSTDVVQMAPLALYNFMDFDEQKAEEGATLLMDVGAEKTDLVVSDGSRIWIRTIQIGGNNFTQALVRAFKLSFAKAENLKRTAATSKYARQIFQAMRPVFADLVQEIQRSIGYYTSLHRDTRFKRLIGLGNGFRLPGLQKFMEQNLNLPVVRVDSYSKLNVASSVNGPAFTENVLAFGVAYGLALQGLGYGQIETNLLPHEIARKRLWDRKRPMFAAAAAVLLIALACWVFRAFRDSSDLGTGKEKLAEAGMISKELNRRQTAFRTYRNQGTGEIEQIHETLKLYGYRNYWPSVLDVVSRSVDYVATDNAAYMQYAKNLAEKNMLESRLEGSVGQRLSDKESKEAKARIIEIQAELDKFLKKPRDKRNLLIVHKLAPKYYADVEAGISGQVRTEEKTKATPGMMPMGPMGPMGPGGGNYAQPQKKTAKPQETKKDAKRGFVIELEVRTPLDKGGADIMIRDLVARCDKLAQDSKAFKVLADKMKIIEIRPVERTLAAATPAATRDRREVRAPMAVPAAGPANGLVIGPVTETKRVVEKVEEAGPENPDPLIPNEDVANDHIVVVRFPITIDDDGVSLPETKTPKRPRRR